ncbi:carboxylesterase family protein [Massilia sp. CFBP9012]|uniref:carboxylesterase/lipase family protein n=1 Tax=Massilia sp. CFBP9012 TaxID=3096531 RepID=UPI002A6ABB1F|nr:carboxylesterase family protein [Massilia sp. CFBP9012]MDY0977192.1 carboxylesterase family protein [Massilia sp. CFBP9012]
MMKKHTIFPRGILAACTVAIGLVAALPSHAQEPVPVATASGPVIGATLRGIESWLGIPYAAPPVGPLRWQPPQPVKPWTTPIKANTLPSSCAQNADLGVFARAGGSEDCLYLNVHRSANAARSGQKLPVFVWIHGGALQVGQGGDYDPGKLATRGKAVVVTLNYRLGVFGFLAHPALDGEGHDFANYGLLDQQTALRWVQRNISAFGGDPANVTIAGESSGGNSVMAHIAAPKSAGLFHHVVAMSGGGIMARHPTFGAPRPLDVAREIGIGFAKAVGCERGGAACMRALPTKRILDAQQPYALNEFVIDGKVLPVHPSDAYRTGRVNRVTLVNGSTRDEGTFFVALPELLTGKALTDGEYPVWLERQYGAALALKVMREYPLANYNSPSEAFAASATDSMFACAGRAMSRALADKMPVYAYEFSDRTAPSYVGATTFPLMAAHTYELAYVFPGFRGGGDAQVLLNPLQEKLSDEMVDYFANLASLPGSAGNWPRFDPAKDNVMTFVLPHARVISGQFADTHHCAFWDRSGSY